MKRIRKIIILLIVLFSLSACKSTTLENKFYSYDDINGYPISIMTGSVFDVIADEYFPDSTQQNYTSFADAVTALIEGKVDASISEASMIVYMCNENPELTYFSKSLGTNSYGAIFSKSDEGKKKCDDFNLFIDELSKSGKLEELENKWFSFPQHDEVIDYEDLPNINGTYSIACDGYTYPFNYYSNQKITGFEIELAAMYCKEKGYSLKVTQYDFSNVLAAVSANKVDAGFAGVIYTDERAENLYYSTLYAEEDIYVMIRKENSAYKYSNINDLKGATIGVLSGGYGGKLVEDSVEDANIVYYNSNSDVLQAIDNGKIDAMNISSFSFKNVLNDRTDIQSIYTMDSSPIGFILPQDDSSEYLKNQFNDFFKEIKEDGRLDALFDEWFNDESEKHIDYESLKDTNGTLTAAVCSSIGGNICYFNGDQLYGLDIDIVVEFAKEYGYDIIFQDYDFGGLLASVQTSKVDFGASNITITEERKQSLTFTDPVYNDDMLLYVKADNAVNENTNFITEIKDSFNKTFVSENRYRLFLNGIGSTLLITFSTIVCGFVLGSLLFYLFRRNNTIMNKVLDFYAWLINGMPTVVLLMVFFYIVFGKTKISGMIISIIAFTCVFSVSIMGLLKTCFMAVDKGQFEAAYALGYSKRQTISKVIIPEIAPMFFPSFRADVITLLKSTSIVGYIAVQDLTKASDIVRSRTYEAFFPLIVTTIIYFILGAIINGVIKAIERKYNPKNKTIESVLKGVNYHD